MNARLHDVATRRLSPLARYELRVVLFGVAFLLVAIPFGLLLHQVLSDGPVTTFDEDLASSLNGFFHDRPLAIDVLEAISFTGKPIFLFFAIGAPVVWLIDRGGSKLALFLVVTWVSAGVLDTVVKIAVGRPRPQVEEPIHHAVGNSFPSGHALQSVTGYGALLLVLLPLLPVRWRRPAIAGTVLWVLLIGFTRLALGVHYVSDVVGGIVLGSAWLAASVAAFEIWREDRGRRRTHPLEEGVEPEEAGKLVER